MERTCKNCEHRSVCGIMTTDNGLCSEWTGWVPVEEELPTDRGDKVVIVRRAGCCRYAIMNYNEHKLPFSEKTIGWGHDSFSEFNFLKDKVIAWREPPKWEGSSI